MHPLQQWMCVVRQRRSGQQVLKAMLECHWAWPGPVDQLRHQQRAYLRGPRPRRRQGSRLSGARCAAQAPS
eukprot:3721534-Lingulodinium_polyedra.AAC.1